MKKTNKSKPAEAIIARQQEITPPTTRLSPRHSSDTHEQRDSAGEASKFHPSRLPDTSFLSSMRLPMNYAALTTVRKVLTTIPIRKPAAQSFVRVRPGDDWRDAFAVIDDKEQGDTHIVVPALAAELASEARLKQFYTYISRDGSVGIWPINLPGADGRLDEWSQSAHRAAEIAESKWIRLQSNRQLGAYDVIEALGIVDEPKWPEETFDQLLRIAFRDRVIDSLDHPLVRRLKGHV